MNWEAGASRQPASPKTCREEPTKGEITHTSEGEAGCSRFLPRALLLFPFGTRGFRPMSAASPQPVTMIEMVFPDQTNHYGTFFGGHALRLMDKAAFVAASRYARRTVVTACSERVDFKNPARHGNLIELI